MNFLFRSHDQKSDMTIETDDADTGTARDDLVEKVFVGETGADVHFFLGEEGADDSLRGLLGEADSFHLEARIAENGGDEVAAGDFSRARGLAGSVKIPGGPEPTAHHFGELCFEKSLGLVDHVRDFSGGAGAGISLDQALTMLCQFVDQLLVSFGIGLGGRKGGGLCGLKVLPVKIKQSGLEIAPAEGRPECQEENDDESV